MNTRIITIALFVALIVIVSVLIGFAMNNVDMSGMPAFSSTLSNNGGKIDKESFCTAADVLSNICAR